MTYTWSFAAPAEEITVDDGNDSYTYTGAQIPMGGYSYTVEDFEESATVTISAIGYNSTTATVGDAFVAMTEMPEVSILNGNSTNYLIKDPKARKMIEAIAAQIYEDLQNYVDKSTAQTIGGQKTLTSALSINNENIHLRTNFTKGTVPSSDIWRQYTFCDNSGNSGNDHKLGCLVAVSSADGAETTRMLAYKNVAGNTDNTQLYIGYNASGTIITSAPACTNTNCIITQTSRSVGTNQNDKFGFGNGLKIATAKIEGTKNADVTWSYGITFTSAPAITICRLSGASTSNNVPMYVRGGPGTSNAKIYSTQTTSWSCFVTAIGH